MDSTLVPIDVGRSQPYMLEITYHDVPMRNLPESLRGTTLVHMSDLHGGCGPLSPVYEEAIARVNALEPDIVALTGDYIDDSVGPEGYPLLDVLRRLRARRGIFGSFGNHDHRRGTVATGRLLEQAGVRVLNNANVCIEPGLWLAGVDDFYEGQPDLKRALSGLPDNATSILLSHNPRFLERVGDRDILVLSGHTHGGQIALPILTPKLVCLLHLRCAFVAGWYSNGRARLYVNRGLGVTGRPFRYRCPAEIGVFRLVPDPEARNASNGAQALTVAPPEPVGRS